MSNYDPKRDVCLRCECRDDGETGYDNWSDTFADLVAEEVKRLKEEIETVPCPRAFVRHAAARLAANIAILEMHSDKTSAELILRELPNMLRFMIDDARTVMEHDPHDRLARSRTAGWKRIN